MKKGFTLVELAIVLIVIGLITAIVTSGRSIIQASEARSVMSEIRKHMQSFNQFTERYHAYPGDFRNFSTVFQAGTTAAMNLANSPVNQNIQLTDYNGNGDNQIKWSDAEGTKAWLQMQIAGLTDNIGNSGDPRNTTATLRVTVPASNIGGGGNGYFIDYSPAMQNFLGLGGISAGGGINNKSALSPERAEAIDRKLDDDNPSTGFVQSINGTPVPATNCINGSGGYNIGGTTQDMLACVLMIRLN